MTRLALGVLVSGSGTNLQAILDAVSDGRVDADVRVVVSNKPGVRALARAEAAGVPALCLSHRDYADREAFDAALVEVLRSHGVDWVVLAGFMRVLTRTFLDAFPLRVLNIHPALLPAFPGVHAQAQALAHGVKVTGCTVHLVDHGVDTGPIIAQRAVAVLPSDDVASLTERILAQEHDLLVRVLAAVAAGELVITSDESTGRLRAEAGVR